MRRTVVLLSLVLLLSIPGIAPAENPAEQNHNAEREAVLKMKKGQELIEAAGRIVEETDSSAAKALLKAAQASFKEASKKYEAGEHGPAAKGFSDSIQTAINAVLLSSGPHEEEVREQYIQEAVAVTAERDQDKKMSLLKKATAEVDAFMKAAEKLAASEGSLPSERLEEARELYASSKMKSGEGDYDAALKEMTEAYELATDAVKELKRARGEALTFPKKSLTEPRELLAYELDKNNTYAFFASQSVSDGQKDSISLLKAAKKARDQAQRSIDKGDGAKAIERLRQSTELYLKAIRESGE